MARPKKEGTVKVKVADAVHDGKGGFHPVGAVIEVEDAGSLKAKGLVE